MTIFGVLKGANIWGGRGWKGGSSEVLIVFCFFMVIWACSFCDNLCNSTLKICVLFYANIVFQEQAYIGTLTLRRLFKRIRKITVTGIFQSRFALASFLKAHPWDMTFNQHSGISFSPIMRYNNNVWQMDMTLILPKSGISVENGPWAISIFLFERYLSIT